jgi:hypothetical protein
VTRLRNRTAFAAPLLIAFTLALTACGSDKQSSSTTSAAVSTLAAGAATTLGGVAGSTASTPNVSTATSDTTSGGIEATTAGTAPAGSTITDDTTPIAGGNGASFCGFENDIEKANADVETEDQFITVLKQFEPRMDQWIADAPNARLQASAQAMVDATRATIAAGKAQAFQVDVVDAASGNISTFCASSSNETTP